jgi:nucleoside-diphosphate-sugar epimerase
MTANKVVAITGGTGFIGKLLLDAHIAQKDEVRILSRNKKLNSHRIKFFQGDLAIPGNEKILKEFTKGVDILYNCAGELYKESLMEALHVLGTERLINSSKGEVKRWVQLSSVGAYGPCRKGVINSLSQENPKGFYEITKSQSDKLVRNSGIDFAILRPSIVFSTSMPNHSLLSLIETIRQRLFFYIGSDVIVNYVEVKDVVNAMLLCGKKPEASSKTYILSDNVKLEHMINSLAEGLGVKAPGLHIPEFIIRALVPILGKFKGFPLTQSRLNVLTKKCYYDSSAIEKELGFSFELNLKESFKNYAQSTI